MKNVIITGSNSGLGYETGKIIAESGDYRIILACRNREKAEAAAARMKEESENRNIIAMELDVASLASVRNFVSAYQASGYGSISALLCNAGINGTNTGLTEDGFDVVFATNHLGHFLLTNLPLDEMAEDGRVLVTSSDMHDNPMGSMVWRGTESLAHPDENFAVDRMRYSYSMLCTLYFIYELDRRLRESGSSVRVNAFNPGLMMTHFAPISEEQLNEVKRRMPHRVGDLGRSSAALAALATDEGYHESGKYYDRSTIPTESSNLSYDRENARELWDRSLDYCVDRDTHRA